MGAFLSWIERMNLVTWILALFAAHLVMYLVLGTDNWFWVALEASAVWALALLLLKAIGKAMNKGNRGEGAR